MGYEEKRNGIKPVPSDPLKYMNKAQIRTYRLIAYSGDSDHLFWFYSIT